MSISPLTIARFSARLAVSVLIAVAVNACEKSPDAPEPEAPVSASASPGVTPAAPAETAEVAPSAEWNEWIERFESDYFDANPTFAVYQGKHEYDGLLPDWSPTSLQRQIVALQHARKRTEGFVEQKLSTQQAVEREYLLARIDNDLFSLSGAEAPWNNPLFYVGSLDPSVLLTRPYAPLEKRMAAFTHYLEAVPNATQQIRENLKTPLAPSFVQVGAAAFDGYAAFFRNDVRPIFASVVDPALREPFEAALGPAADAMASLGTWLGQQGGDGTASFALGEERYTRMLFDTERVDTPIDQLEAVGKADLMRNEDALAGACAVYAAGASVEACIARAAAHKPPDGPVVAARQQLVGLREFVVDHDIVSIPSDELALVEEAPPYQRSNAAYIDVPGPYDKGMPSIYYIAPPDPAWSAEDQAAYIPSVGDLLFVSVHEVWPGHFLQFLHANRSPSSIGRLFVGYAFAEGWAHYTEEMMWEQGLGDGAPEIHIGQLTNALLRNVRFLCSIGLHTRGMSVAECETMFREHAHQDPGNARQQAARGTYDPGYLNYTLGKLMIMKLRADWLRLNPGATLKAFHDAFLKFGGPPIPLVRKAMLGDQDDGELLPVATEHPPEAIA